MSRFGSFAGRVAEVAVAGLLLVCLPLLGIAAVAVYLESGRPFFYGHQRVGQGGRAFQC